MTKENNYRLGKQVVAELRERQTETYKPSGDIDLVWVSSGHGTVTTPPDSGLYKGFPKDREKVEAGIEIVKQITALRMGKEVDEVTKTDIATHGPILFYNGEEEGQGSYHQNEDLRKWMEDPDFPLPKEGVVVKTLEEIYTPSQVKSLAEYLQLNSGIKKIAVVTHAPHSRRMGRYLKRHQELFQDIEFEEACVPERDVPVGAVFGEIKRIEAYAIKGDLNRTSLY
jgi:hypothetical protein